MGRIDDRKAGGERCNGLAALVNVMLVDRSEAAGRRSQILHAVGIQLHQTGAGGVDGGQVGSDDEASEWFGSTHDRPVALHADDGVNDGEVRLDRGVDIENGLRNSGVMQDILRPAVDDARHDAEEVFHGAGDAGPVVRLQLGHGDDEVRGEERPGQVQFAEGAPASGRWRRRQRHRD